MVVYIDTMDLGGKTLIKGPKRHHERLPDNILDRQFISNEAKFQTTEDFSFRPNTIVRKKV